MGHKALLWQNGPVRIVPRSEPMSEGTEQIERLMQQAARLYQEGRYEQALPVAREACDLAQRWAGVQHPLFADSLHNLAALYHAMGEHAAALPLARQPVEVCRAAPGAAQPPLRHRH